MISVIVPVYNSEKYLFRCLESILANTYKDLEIICVNDGSTDESGKILAEYSRKDSRIKVINKNNGGLSSARNAGIKESKGKYLTFIDSDDWVHPQYFEILENAIVNDNSDAVTCCFQKSNGVDSVEFHYVDLNNTNYKKTVEIQTFLTDKTFRAHCVYACGVLYRTDKIHFLFPEGIKVIEDNLFNTMNLTTYSKITIINLPLYVYYQNSDSIMHTYSCNDAFKGLMWSCDFLFSNNIELNVRKALIEFTYKRCMFYRYAFTKINQKKEAEKYVVVCRKQLVKLDACVSAKKRMIFRTILRFPVIYAFYKRIKGEVIDADKLFSLAEIKKPV